MSSWPVRPVVLAFERAARSFQDLLPPASAAARNASK